ncbi:MAG: cadherin-like domain-containing protein, partial [Magnetococcales bacterium]|nr:cadherin-like domain-containing protein [Magnetococcales bacterium]
EGEGEGEAAAEGEGEAAAEGEAPAEGEAAGEGEAPAEGAAEVAQELNAEANQELSAEVAQEQSAEGELQGAQAIDQALNQETQAQEQTTVETTNTVAVESTLATTTTTTTEVIVEPVYINAFPVVADEEFFATEDTSLTFLLSDILSNDSDADGDAISLVESPTVSNGSLVDNGDGSYTYTSNTDYFGQDTIVYRVQDGNGGYATGNALIYIDPIADTPYFTLPESGSATQAVTKMTVKEDTVSDLIVLARNDNDSTEVTHFQISNIKGGALYFASGDSIDKERGPITDGDFITYDEGVTGLRFLANENSHGVGAGSFSVAPSQDGTTPAQDDDLALATITIDVAPVGDGVILELDSGEISAELIEITVDEDTTTGVFTIDRNAVDSDEVTHFYIDNIVGGQLYLVLADDGSTDKLIAEGSTISYQEGQNGIVFKPYPNSDIDGSFQVSPSVDGSTPSLASNATVAKVNVNVLPVVDTPNLYVEASQGSEDYSIPLHIATSLADTDGSEVISVTIQGIPEGAKLLNRDGGELFVSTQANSGEFTFSNSELSALQTPIEFTSAEVLYKNLFSLISDSYTIPPDTNLVISATVATTASDPGTTVSLTFTDDFYDSSVVPTEFSNLTFPVEGSGVGSVTFTGLSGIDLFGDNTATGSYDISTGIWTLSESNINDMLVTEQNSNLPDELLGLSIVPVANDSTKITLNVVTTATENDGSSTTSQQSVDVIIDPVSDGFASFDANLGAESWNGTSYEYSLPITTTFNDTDGSEITSSFTISGLPTTGVSLSAGSNNGDGSWTLTNPTSTQLSQLTIYSGSIKLPSSMAVSIVATNTDTNSEGTVDTTTSSTPPTLSLNPSGSYSIFSSNFSTSPVTADPEASNAVILTGNAYVTASGELYLAGGYGQSGSILVDPGGLVEDFNAQFDIYIGSPNSGTPADGFSFNYTNGGENLPGGYPYEDYYPGSGLSVRLDVYDGDGDQNNLQIFYNGLLAGSAAVGYDIVNAGYKTVDIAVDDGVATVSLGGTTLLSNITLTNWAPQASWDFFIGARCGGEYATHLVDNFTIFSDEINVPETGFLTLSDLVVVTDTDANDILSANLAVDLGRGVLNITLAGAATVTGSGTQEVFITGTAADINATLALSEFKPIYTDRSISGIDYATLSVKIKDDYTQVLGSIDINVTPTINAVIGGVVSGSLGEESITTISNTLTIVDPDGTTEEAFVAQSGVVGVYGSFTLDSGGNWSYVLDNSKTQLLTGGSDINYSQGYDYFTAVSVDGSSEIITITIAGENDAATISGTSTGAISEDDTNLITGVLSITDVDYDEALFQPVSNVAGGNNYGSFSLTNSGTWSYTLNNTLATIQSLAAGSSLTDTFIATSHDGGTTETVTVTINGTNDTASISGANSGAVGEDDASPKTGVLSITDVDLGEALFQPISSIAGSNNYGNFSLTDSGTWNYTLNTSHTTVQSLAAGSTLTDTFVATSKDGTASQTVTMTINGANDAATIGGTYTGSIGEDDTTPLTGVLSISDIDTGEALFQPISSVAGSNNYGSFSLTNGGTWSYSLNTTLTAVQSLAAGSSLTDSFVATSHDGGTSQTVTVTIDGASEHRVGYLGSSTHSSIITSAGYEAIPISNLSEANLSGLEMVFLENSSNSSDINTTLYGGYKTDVFDAVAKGMDIIIHDWHANNGATGVSTHLPGNPALDVTRYLVNDGTVSSTVSTTGSNQDFYGTYAMHGYINKSAGSSLAVDVLVYARDDSTKWGTVAYHYDTTSTSGHVIYSTIPLGANLSSTGSYASNLLTYASTLDPIILDLDGDGIELIQEEVVFDMSIDDSLLKPLGWVGADDGVLAFDTNMDGQINNVTELFSELFNGETWSSGLSALSSLDSNQSGSIDSQDTLFDGVLVWVDADSDGVSQTQELYSLNDLGIASISLGANSSQESIWLQDVGEVLSRGNFTWVGGDQGMMVEIGLLVGEGNVNSDTDFPSDPKTEIFAWMDDEVSTIFDLNISDPDPNNTNEKVMAGTIEELLWMQGREYSGINNLNNMDEEGSNNHHFYSNSFFPVNDQEPLAEPLADVANTASGMA